MPKPPVAADTVTLRPHERPTLKTISRITGLAVPTVSRALGDAPDIGRDTKARVKEVARDIGYRPNRAGVRLRTGKTQVISLVLSTDHDVMNQTAMLIGSIAGGLRGTPYHMIVTPYFPDEDLLAPVRYIVESGSADGIILNQTLHEDPRVDYLRSVNFPFTAHGRSQRASEHSYFDFDHRRLGELAMSEFASRQRKSALVIAPALEQNYAQELVQGSNTVAVQHNLSVQVLQGATADHSLEHIEAALATHFDIAPHTDALLCSSITAALAAIALIDERGLEIGKDIDVLTREFIPLFKRFRPGLLTVDEDINLAGEFLARAILRAIENPDEPPLQELEVPGRVNMEPLRP